MNQLSIESLGVQLGALGARINPVALSLPETLPIEEWSQIGRTLCRADAALKWWVGDWANHGLKWGQLKEFCDANGINYQTLSNCMWVCRNVQISRRRENLDFGKHAEVAALETEEEKEKWLEIAETEKLTVVELRKRLRAEGAKMNANAGDGPVIGFRSEAIDKLVVWLKQRPTDFWTDDCRQKWRDRLAPVVAFYNSL